MRKRWLLLPLACIAVTGLVLVRVVRYSQDDRWSLSRLQLERVVSAVELYSADTQSFPASLDVLVRADGPGPGPYLRPRDRYDPWGRALFYRVDPDRRGFVVFTLGRDGRLGGAGADADVQRVSPDQIPRK